MNLTNFEIRTLELPMGGTFSTSEENFSSKKVNILRAQTPEGDWVYGEATSQEVPIYNHEFIAGDIPFLEEQVVPAIQQSLAENTAMEQAIEAYHHSLQDIAGHPMAIAAGDFLMFDLWTMRQAKALPEILYDLYGESCAPPEQVECGASIGTKENVDELVETVENHLEEGYTRIKLKIKEGDDLRPVKAIKNNFPEVPVSVDANGDYNRNNPGHQKVMKKLDQLGLSMIEQPFSTDNFHYRNKELAEELDTPICLDESINHPEDIPIAADAGIEVINVKPQRVRGLYPSVEIAQECEKHNLDLWIGGLLESGVGMTYAIAAASLPSVNRPNDLAPPERYFEGDVLTRQMDDGGYMPTPLNPVQGKIDEEALEEYTVDKVIV